MTVHESLHSVPPVQRHDVAVERIDRAKVEHERTNRRPRAITASEALVAGSHDMHIAMMVASRVLRGDTDVTDADRQSAWAAIGRVNALIEEAVWR